MGYQKVCECLYVKRKGKVREMTKCRLRMCMKGEEEECITPDQQLLYYDINAGPQTPPTSLSLFFTSSFFSAPEEHAVWFSLKVIIG